MEIKNYDLIIIGGGPAGYSAAIYAVRYGLKVLVIAKERGGLITKTHMIENYPGFSSLSGYDLMQNFENHLKYYDIEVLDDVVVDVKKLDDDNGNFNVKTYAKKEFIGKSIIIATGTKRKELNVKGEKEFYGKGVSYCATCDAMFYRNKTVCVIGGSDSAAKESLVLSQHSEKVYIIYRGVKLRAEPINLKRVQEKKNIEIIYNTNITEIKGEVGVKSVILDNEYNDSNELEVQGVFIEIGHLPQNELAKSLNVNLSDSGDIIVDKFMRTNVKRVYAAGDIIDFAFRQVVVSAAHGSIAAWSVYEDLEK